MPRRCGFSLDQRAIVKAKAAKCAAPDMETVMRRVVPLCKVPKQRRAEDGALLAEPLGDDEDDRMTDETFDGLLSSRGNDDDFADIGALQAD